jgi:hypothetical protein
MADLKISGLPASSVPLAGTEVLPIVQSSATKKVAVSDLTAGRAVSALSLALTNALPTTSGGTGLASFTANALIYASNTSTLATSADFTYDGTNVSQSKNSATPINYTINNNNAGTSAGGRYQFSYGGIVVGWVANKFDGGDFNNDYVASQNHYFFTSNTSPTRRFVIGNNGNVTVDTGNLVIGTSGKGVSLPGGITWTSGAGSPEGVVTAPVGSLYSRSDGGLLTSLYVKESGSGNTGWAGK